MDNCIRELDPQQFGVGQYHECLLPEPDYISILQQSNPELFQFFKERVLDKSEEEIKEEESHEQGSVQWKDARTKNPRLPASKWGAIAKHCPYSANYEALVNEMLYVPMTLKQPIIKTMKLFLGMSNSKETK